MEIPTIERTKQLLQQCYGKKIAVIGDVMLDRYFWGSVSRLSPEAPVPVVDIESESFHLGGASNVAKNLRALGIESTMVGVVGDDNSGKIIREILEQSTMVTHGIITVAERPTTVKTRVIGNNQQITRLDREVKTPISEAESEKILDVLRSTPSLSGIIVEDYNKGVITPFLIRSVITFAAEFSIPVFVDPKFNNFFEYQGVTLFKPNKKETQDALGFALNNDEDIYRAGAELLHQLACKNVLITLGSRGMMLFENNGAVSSVPTRARHVADVSGAGDTAIATLAAMVSGGADMSEAAALANLAAGIVCEEPGIVTIEPQRLLKSLVD